MDHAAFTRFLSNVLNAPVVPAGPPAAQPQMATAPAPAAPAPPSPAASAAASTVTVAAGAAPPVPPSPPVPTPMPLPPPASVDLAALRSPAPPGFVARGLVRIRRPRSLHAPASSPPRAMYVTRVSSKLVPLSMEEMEEEGELANDARHDAHESHAAPGGKTPHLSWPLPARSNFVPPAAAASPYKFGAVSLPSPPTPTAAHPEPAPSPAASPPAAAAAASPSPRSRTQRVAPKRRRAQVEYDEDEDEEEEEARGGSDGEEGEESRSDARAQTPVGIEEGEIVDEDEPMAEQASEAEGSVAGDEMGSASVQPVKNPNMSARQRAIAKLPTNRSGVHSLNLFLRRIGYRTHDMHALTSQEFIDLMPRYVLEARMQGGAPYVWTTLKGYMHTLQRVVRGFQPHSEWGNIVLKDMPSIRQAITELRAREHESAKARAMEGMEAGNGAAAGAAASSAASGEMTTRRALRIANGEFVMPVRDPGSQPSSAPNSPRAGADGDFSTSGGRGRTSLLPKLSAEQEAHMLAQLDPQHPEGLFRLTFVAIVKHFGITYAEEHRGLTVRNFLRGSRVVRVRYEGGRRPKQEALPEAGTEATSRTPASAEVSADTAAVASAAAESSAAANAADAAPAAPAPSADAMDTSGPGSESAAPADAAADVKPSVGNSADSATPSDTSQLPEASAAASTLFASTAASDPVASDLPFADDSTPFEVVDQSSTDPSHCWRRVRFVAFVPGPMSKRSLSFMYERPWEGVYCPVALYEAYLSHRPPLLTELVPGLQPEDIETTHSLWLKCKRNFGPCDSEWFQARTLGRVKINTLIANLTQGLGFAQGFSNSSISYQPKQPIPLSAEELEQLRQENAAHHYGVPTRAQHAQMQHALMAAVSAAPAAPARSASAAHSMQSHEHVASSMSPPTASSSRRHRHESYAQAAAPSPAAPSSAAPPPAQPSAAAYAPFVQMLQQSQQQASASGGASSSVDGTCTAAGALTDRRNFYPSAQELAPDYLQRNQRVLQQIDEANARQLQEHRQRRQDGHAAAPGLASPLEPMAAAAAPAASSLPSPQLTLTPSSVQSVPELLLLLDRFHREMSALSSHALQCQRSLESFKSLAAQLQSEASGALKVQQQAAKIAEQFRIIEEQRFIIEQLQAERRPPMQQQAGEAIEGTVPPATRGESGSAADGAGVPVPATASGTAAAGVASSPSPAAAVTAPVPSDVPPPPSDEHKEGPSSMQLDDDEEDLPPLVAPAEAKKEEAEAQPQAQQQQKDVTDEKQAAAMDTDSGAPSSAAPAKLPPSRFHDQQTALLL